MAFIRFVLARPIERSHIPCLRRHFYRHSLLRMDHAIRLDCGVAMIMDGRFGYVLAPVQIYVATPHPRSANFDTVLPDNER